MKISNLSAAMREMFDFIADMPSGLDGFRSDFDAAFSELHALEGKGVEIDQFKGWIRTVDRKPDEEYKAWKEAGHRDDPQFIVYIRFAKLTTCLYYDGREWRDEYGDAYDVTHWMKMPEVPE